MKDKVRQKHIIQMDLSGCKNWSECKKVIDMVTSGKVKITLNEHIR